MTLALHANLNAKMDQLNGLAYVEGDRTPEIEFKLEEAYMRQDVEVCNSLLKGVKSYFSLATRSAELAGFSIATRSPELAGFIVATHSLELAGFSIATRSPELAGFIIAIYT